MSERTRCMTSRDVIFHGSGRASPPVYFASFQFSEFSFLCVFAWWKHHQMVMTTNCLPLYQQLCHPSSIIWMGAVKAAVRRTIHGVISDPFLSLYWIHEVRLDAYFEVPTKGCPIQYKHPFSIYSEYINRKNISNLIWYKIFRWKIDLVAEKQCRFKYFYVKIARKSQFWRRRWQFAK